MTDTRPQQMGEEQLEALLRALIEDKTEALQGLATGETASADILELRDMARRLRATIQLPLPEGRLAVRRALVAATQNSRAASLRTRMQWPRPAQRIAATAVAVAVVVLAFGLGIFLPKHRATIMPIRESGEYALTYEFSAVHLPQAGGVATAAGIVGGLPAALSLATARSCPAAEVCGTFIVSVAGLSDVKARAAFGQLRGMFICASDVCTLTLQRSTGVFARVTGSALVLRTAGTIAGRLDASFASLGDWVSTVAWTAESLSVRGILPASVNLTDLLAEAAAYEGADHSTGDVGIDKSASAGGSPAGPTRGSASRPASGRDRIGEARIPVAGTSGGKRGGQVARRGNSYGGVGQGAGNPPGIRPTNTDGIGGGGSGKTGVRVTGGVKRNGADTSVGGDRVEDRQSGAEGAPSVLSSSRTTTGGGTTKSEKPGGSASKMGKAGDFERSGGGDEMSSQGDSGSQGNTGGQSNGGSQSGSNQGSTGGQGAGSGGKGNDVDKSDKDGRDKGGGGGSGSDERGRDKGGGGKDGGHGSDKGGGERDGGHGGDRGGGDKGGGDKDGGHGGDRGGWR